VNACRASADRKTHGSERGRRAVRASNGVVIPSPFFPSREAEPHIRMRGGERERDTHVEFRGRSGDIIVIPHF